MSQDPQPPSNPVETFRETSNTLAKKVPPNQALTALVFLFAVVGGGYFISNSTGPTQVAGGLVILLFLVTVLVFQYKTIGGPTTVANPTYEMIIRVLSDEGMPVKGALVTVIGPVDLTKRPTNEHGRIEYTYTEKDATNYRNMDITIHIEYKGLKVSTDRPLSKQGGEPVNIKLPATSKPSEIVRGSQQPRVQQPVTAGPAINKPSQTNGASSMSERNDLSRRAAEFVIPHVAGEQSRKALVSRAFFGEKYVHDNVNYQGSAAEFSTNLITQLWANGGVNDVVTLLDTIIVGPDKKAQIQALIQELRAHQ